MEWPGWVPEKVRTPPHIRSARTSQPFVKPLDAAHTLRPLDYCAPCIACNIGRAAAHSLGAVPCFHICNQKQSRQKQCTMWRPADRADSMRQARPSRDKIRSADLVVTVTLFLDPHTRPEDRRLPLKTQLQDASVVLFMVPFLRPKRAIHADSGIGSEISRTAPLGPAALARRST